MILKHRVCLVVNTADSLWAEQIVRDFRGSTRSILLGATPWAAHGMSLVRRLLMLGSPNEGGPLEMLADTRLYGDPAEVYDAALEVLVQEIHGITVAADVGLAALQAARQAALDSRQRSYRETPPLVLGRLPPPRVEPKAMLARAKLLPTLAKQLAAAKIDGLIVAVADLPLIWGPAKTSKLPLCVYAQRPALDNDRLPPGAARLAGPAELLDKGVPAVLYDVVKLLGKSNRERAADCLELCLKHRESHA